MAPSPLAALDQGGDYQARWFWLEACRLLLPQTRVQRVGYEVALARAFDDVVTTYDPARPLLDARDQPVHVDCYQAKYHVDHTGTYTHRSLVDPAAIGATKVSFLERLQQARARFEQNGRRGRFTLLSPWAIDPNDVLADLVSHAETGELRLERLKRGGPKSEHGRARALWRDHLGLSSDDDLYEILQSLRIRANVSPLGMLRAWLNDRLARVGLRPIEDDQIAFHYDDLARKIGQRDLREFDATALRQLAEGEGLWVGSPAQADEPRRIGVRSFLRLAEHMEDETDSMLSLLPSFDGRTIRAPSDWDAVIVPAVDAFIRREVQPGGVYLFRPDCHTSITFAVGYCVGPKAAADITVLQKGFAQRQRWRADESAAPPHGPLWDIRDVPLTEGAPDVVVAVSITHDVLADVERYARTSVPSAGRILVFTIQGGPSNTAVADGTHAYQLARALVAQVRAARTLDERQGRVHLLGAMPDGVAYYLGRLAHVLGPLTTYEFDFDTMAPGAYRPGPQFPPPAVRP